MAETSTDRIEKSIEIDAPVERVWRALTDYREFGQWFRVNLEGPFVTGRTIRGQITYPGYEHLVMEVVVGEMERPRVFSYRWRPTAVDPGVDTSMDPTTLVEFRLEAAGEGTLLRLTESGFDAIPAARRDEAFRRNDGGWTEQMQNIKNHADKNR